MQKIKIGITGICFLLFLWGNICLAGEIEITGNISHNLVYLLKGERLSQNTTQYQLSLKKDSPWGEGKMYLSFKGGYDSIGGKNIEPIELDEVYGDIYLENTDLRIGRQVVSWGTADGINPTNYINPKEISLVESELKGKPLACLQATHYSKIGDISGVVVFDYQPQEIPEELETALGQTIPGFEGFPELPEPEKTLKNMEFALKVEKIIAGWDVKLSYFYGWEDYPALWIELEPGFPPQFQFKSQYQRVNKIGLATAGSFKKMGLWSEAAYIMPEEIEEMQQASTLFSMNEPYLQVVLGADYTFKGVYCEGQYIYYGNGSLINPYLQHQPGEKITAGNYFMTQLSYKINQIHNLKLGGIANLQDSSYTLMPQYTCALNEVTDLSLRVALFYGEEETEFGMWEDKELIDIGIKVSF